MTAFATQFAPPSRTLASRRRAPIARQRRLGVTILGTLMPGVFVLPCRWTLDIPRRKPEAAKLLAEAEEFYGRKQYAEAAALYQKMIALDEHDHIAHLLYGDTFFFGGHDYAAALSEYRKALAIDATNPAAYFFSANALMRLDRADDARAAVVAALSYDRRTRASTARAAVSRRGERSR